MIICPNLKNPDVAREFNELKSIVGESAAYYIWSSNNGNSIDKAPNGALSVLFKDLLKIKGGDRQEAIIAKAKTFSTTFKNNFVKNDKTLDKNGEPLCKNVIEYYQHYNKSNTDAKKLVKEIINYASTRTNKLIEDELKKLREQHNSWNKLSDVEKERIKEYIRRIVKSELLGKYTTFQGLYVVNNLNIIFDSPKRGANAIKKAQEELKDLYLGPSILSIPNTLALRRIAVERNPTKSVRQLLRIGENNTKPVKLSLSKKETLFEYLFSNVHGTSVHMEAVVDILKKALHDVDLNIVFCDSDLLKGSAYFDHSTNTIYIDKNGYFINHLKYDPVVQTLIHELIHAATVNAIKKNKQLYNLLDELRKKVKKELIKQQVDSNYYGLTDVFEFLSELSNPKFVNVLKLIYIQEDFDLFKTSVFDKIVLILLKVFKGLFEKRYIDEIEKHRNTAYSEAMDLFLKASFPTESGLSLNDRVSDQNIFWQIEPEYKKRLKNKVNVIVQRYESLYNVYQKRQNKSANVEQTEARLYEFLNKIKHEEDALVLFHTMDDTFLRLLNVKNYIENEIKTAEDKQSPYNNVSAQIIVHIYRTVLQPAKAMLLLLPNVEELKYFYDGTEKISTKDSQGTETTINLLNNAKDIRRKLDLLIDVVNKQWVKALYAVGEREIDMLMLNGKSNTVALTNEEIKDISLVIKDYFKACGYYGDISKFNAILTNYMYSNNTLIKLMAKQIMDALTLTRIDSYPSLIKIAKAYRNADKNLSKYFTPGWQKILQETDENGVPTGYFIRDRKYGVYKKDLENFITDLNKRFENKYGFYYIDNGGNYINSVTGESSDNEEWIYDPVSNTYSAPPFVKYLTEIEKFKGTRAHRRYAPEYYLERLSKPYDSTIDPSLLPDNSTNFDHGLSPKTLREYSYILRNINYYLDECTDEKGFVRPERLSNNKKLRLDYWEELLKDLSNPYDKIGNLKTDDEAIKMAYEIRAWQKWISLLTNQETSMMLYEVEYNKVEKTNNQKLISDFVRYNANIGINPDLLDFIFGTIKPIYPDTEDFLTNPNKIARDILIESTSDLIKTKDGSYGKDFSALKNNPAFFQQQRRLEQDQIDSGVAFPKKTRHHNTYIDPRSKRPRFEDIFSKEDSPLLEELLDNFVDMVKNSPLRTLPGVVDDSGNPIVFNGTDSLIRQSIKNELFTIHYVDKDTQELQYDSLSILKILQPKVTQFTDNYTGRTFKTIVHIPKRSFSKKVGWFVNDQYDTNNSEKELPRLDFDNGRYDNKKQMHKITSDQKLKELYDTLIDEMKKAQSLYSNNINFNYKLPQITASQSLIISRIILGNIQDGLDKLWQSLVSIEDNDTELRTTQSYNMGPDGKPLVDVPLRFLSDLKDPAFITSDVASSVCMFVTMANFYKNGKNIDDIIRLMRYGMEYENRQVYNTEMEGVVLDQSIPGAPIDPRNSILQYDAMVNANLYGNESGGAPILTSKNNVRSSTNNGFLSALYTGLSFGALGTTSSAAGAGLTNITGYILSSLGVLSPGAISLSIGASTLIGGGISAIVGTLYGLTWYNAKKKAGYEISSYKIAQSAQQIGTFHMLALNILSQLTGFIDSTTKHIIDATWGKYFKIPDLISSIIYCIGRLPALIYNIGNPLPNNKISGLMKILLGRGTPFINLAKGRTRKTVSKVLMGGFELGDYLSTGLLTCSVFHNYVYYNGDIIPKGFYSSYLLNRLLKANGVKSFQRKLIYNKCAINCRLLHYIDKNGNIDVERIKRRCYPKDTDIEDVKSTIPSNLLLDITSSILSRAAIANGMNIEGDTPLWRQNALGRLVGAMRTYIAQNVQNQIRHRPDNIMPEVVETVVDEVEGQKTKRKIEYKDNIDKKQKQELRTKRMAFNFATGTIQDEIFASMLSAFGTTLYNIKGLFNNRFVKYSERELDGIKSFLSTLIVGAVLALSATFCCDKALEYKQQWEKKEKTTPVSQRRNLLPPVFYDIPGQYEYAVDQGLDFISWDLAAATGTRVTENIMNNQLFPLGWMDVITTPTVYTSVIEGMKYSVDDMLYYMGIGDKNPEDIQNRGSYKYNTRGETSFMKFSGIPAHLHSILSPYHRLQTHSWYAQQSKTGTDLLNLTLNNINSLLPEYIDIPEINLNPKNRIPESNTIERKLNKWEQKKYDKLNRKLKKIEKISNPREKEIALKAINKDIEMFKRNLKTEKEMYRRSLEIEEKVKR